MLMGYETYHPPMDILDELLATPQYQLSDELMSIVNDKPK
jgi:hypothetical protein